ncbi:MAG: glycine oxidase ThiO [Burkholderiales bacterium]
MSDCIVIGAGVIGMATALELQRRGATVTVVERGTVGAEASWAGGGLLFPLMPWDYEPAATELALHSAALYPEWTAGLAEVSGIDPEWRQSGMVMLADPGPRGRRWCTQYGVPYEFVSARSIVPQLGADSEALWLPQVAQVRNPRLMRALAMAATQAGVEIREHTEALEFEIDGGGQVVSLTTSNGALRAKHYLVCTGAWTATWLGAHAAGLPVKPMKGEMLLYRAQRGWPPAIVYDGTVYIIPRDDGHVLVGSTTEDRGFDKSLTAAARDKLAARAQTLLPALAEIPRIGHWAGLRPGSPDNVPIIARHPHLENLYVNTGHFRYGITMAPASAHVCADLVLGEMTVAPEAYRWHAAGAAAPHCV